MARKKRTIQNQIVRALVGISIVTTVLFLIVFQHIRYIIIRQYGNAAEQSVHAVSENLDYILLEIENLSKSILFNHDLVEAFKKENQEYFLTQLTSYYNSNPNIEGIYVGINENYWHIGSNIEYEKENFSNEVLKHTSGEIVWMPAREVNVQILSGRIPRNYFSMARKIVDIHSLEEIGSLRIEMDERILQQTYANLKEPGAEIYVIDGGGNVISSSNNANFEHAFLQEIKNDRVSGVLEYRGDQHDWVAIYSVLNQGNWKIVKTIPKATLYSEVNHLQLQVMFGIGLVSALILLAGFFYSNQISKPILRMMRQMKDVEKGDFSVRVDTDAANELGDLGESFNHMIGKIQGLMDEIVTAERNKNEMELEILHAQINPHFLYNTLNTIRLMAKIKGEDSISNALVALARLLRVSISFGKNMITLQEEIAYIENYLLIQQLRFNQSFQVQYEIREEDRDVLIPKLILQPIVENSLIYGIEKSKEAVNDDGHLMIRVFTENSECGIKIIVEDNGPGISPEAIECIFKQEKNINKFNKVGLNNIKQRIKMYFGKAYDLQVVSAPSKGTKVILSIPRCTERKE